MTRFLYAVKDLKDDQDSLVNVLLNLLYSNQELFHIFEVHLHFNPLLSPPGGLFFSSTFEGGLNREGGLKREGGLI